MRNRVLLLNDMLCDWSKQENQEMIGRPPEGCLEATNLRVPSLLPSSRFPDVQRQLVMAGANEKKRVSDEVVSALQNANTLKGRGRGSAAPVSRVTVPLSDSARGESWRGS